MSGTRAAIGRAAPRILITGGCGFVGSNLADALASRGQPILALDTLGRPGVEENAAWLRQRHGDLVKVEVGDVRDLNVVAEAVRSASAVLHLAAQVAVTTSLEDPIADFEVNARGTLNVLEAVRRHDSALPVLFASTNKVYGRLFAGDEVVLEDEGYRPASAAYDAGVNEGSPLDLHSPYGCSKGAADQYVRDYARVFGLRTAVLRMSCIYGRRQFGTEDQGWIAHFMLQALEGRSITIFGDGHQVRDALYIGDAVAAWSGVLDHIEDCSGRIFNLGGGPSNAVSLRGMLKLLGQVLGEPPEMHFAAWRPGDQPWYVTDVRALSDAIGWSPRVSIPEGLRRLRGWLEPRISSKSADLCKRRAHEGGAD